MNFKKLLMKIDQRGVLLGLVGGILGSLCCITPLFLIFFGLGSASFAFSLVWYKPLFLFLSLIFTLASLFYLLKKRECYRKNTSQFRLLVLSSLTVELLTFAFTLYIFVPKAGDIIYGNFFKNDQVIAGCQLKVKLVKSDVLSNFSCVSCEASLRYRLESIKGVKSAFVDINNLEATIFYDASLFDKESIKKQNLGGYYLVFIDSAVYNNQEHC